MKTVTTHQAKTHLSRLIKEVQTGETVVILNGSVPVAELRATQQTYTSRPKTGTITSETVKYDDDAFNPLTDNDLKVWGI
jgi:antitoxin (DNA-binding transcriptional repressor) of toxin-antitoxin stability system